MCSACLKSPMVVLGRLLLVYAILLGGTSITAAELASFRYFPAGDIYEYRWKLLELVLARTQAADGPMQLQAAAEGATQNRGIELMQAGEIDVIALGTNGERESKLRPIRTDILRGMVGFRLLVIRASDQDRIARMDDAALRKQLTFGLNRQWADLPAMQKMAIRWSPHQATTTCLTCWRRDGLTLSHAA